MKRELVYLAAPYSNPDPSVVQARYEAVNRVAGGLMREGLVVFSPISHSHPIDATFEKPEGWDFWKVQDFGILELCERLLVLPLPGWRDSVGVNAEIDYAESLNIPVTFLKVTI